MAQRFCTLALIAGFAGSLAAGPTVRAAAQGFGFGAPQQEVKVVERFDTDGDKRLNAEERRAARASMGGWSTRPGRMGFALPAATPGPRLTPSQVRTYGSEPSTTSPRSVRFSCGSTPPTGNRS